MNAERLLAIFERISEAPDAIPRLRRFILDLAVRGKLVEQDPQDEPAEELLQCLRKTGINPHSSVLSGDSFPFVLPASWAPATLGDLVEASNSGWSPKTLDLPREGEEWGILKVSAVSWEHFQPDANKQVLPGTQPKPQAVIKNGDFLISRANTAELVARAVIVDCDPVNLMMSDKIVRLQLVELCEPRYILIVNNHATFARSYYASRATGVSPSMKNVSRDVILGLPLPLPPLAEQHRIVAKVDELMALCDQLEAARTQRVQCRERLVAASLQRLNQPSDDLESLRSDARFALQVLPRLTTTPAQIKQLRQTILNLAVRGKLVEQDPADEPAIITVTGALLAAADSPRKKVRKKASWTPPTENENQELPAGWHLFSLAELFDPASPLSYGVLVPGDNVSDGVPFVRAQDLMLKGHPALPGKKIAQDIESKYARTRLMGGEILICVVGSIGKIGVVPEHWSGANIARAVARLKLIPEVSAAYMLLVLQSGMIQGFFKDSTRTLAQPTLNIGLVEATPIPLPPLAEQHRIVARVDALMALCDQLEQQLSQAEQSRRGLLEAVLQEVLVEPVASVALLE